MWAKLGEKLGMMTQVAFANDGSFLIAATGGGNGAKAYLFKMPKRD